MSILPLAESHPEKVRLCSFLIIAELTKAKTRVGYSATRLCCLPCRQIRADSKCFGGGLLSLTPSYFNLFFLFEALTN